LSDRHALELAEGAANRALELDPDSAGAHTAAGGVRLATFRPHTAEREFRRALQLNPNSADAEVWYAITLVRLGRVHEAIAHAERAAKLDPNSPSTNWYVGLAYGYAGDDKRLREQVGKVLQLDPNFPMAHFIKAWGEAFSGKGSGRCDNEHLRLAGRNPERLAFLAYCYGKTGRMGEAKRKFHEMETDPNFPNMYPRMLAYAYIGLGDKDKAIAVKQRAFDDRTPWFDEILLGPCELDPDPRFQAIKQQVRDLYAEDR
jgi:tetratricopeptide (TPR) repeat protein